MLPKTNQIRYILNHYSKLQLIVFLSLVACRQRNLTVLKTENQNLPNDSISLSLEKEYYPKDFWVRGCIALRDPGSKNQCSEIASEISDLTYELSSDLPYSQYGFSSKSEMDNFVEILESEAKKQPVIFSPVGSEIEKKRYLILKDWLELEQKRRKIDSAALSFLGAIKPAIATNDSGVLIVYSKDGLEYHWKDGVLIDRKQVDREEFYDLLSVKLTNDKGIFTDGPNGLGILNWKGGLSSIRSEPKFNDRYKPFGTPIVSPVVFFDSKKFKDLFAFANQDQVAWFADFHPISRYVFENGNKAISGAVFAGESRVAVVTELNGSKSQPEQTSQNNYRKWEVWWLEADLHKEIGPQDIGHADVKWRYVPSAQERLNYEFDTNRHVVSMQDGTVILCTDGNNIFWFKDGKKMFTYQFPEVVKYLKPGPNNSVIGFGDSGKIEVLREGSLYSSQKVSVQWNTRIASVELHGKDQVVIVHDGGVYFIKLKMP